MDDKSSSFFHFYDFDFDLDFHRIHEQAARASLSLERLGEQLAGIFYWQQTDQWCMVVSYLTGEMVRGVDWPMHVGGATDVGPLEVPYHPGLSLPLVVRVLGLATHADAERIWGKPLAPRAYYYFVTTD